MSKYGHVPYIIAKQAATLTSADEGVRHPAATSPSHPLILKLVYNGHQLQNPA